jgi:transposase
VSPLVVTSAYQVRVEFLFLPASGNTRSKAETAEKGKAIDKEQRRVAKAQLVAGMQMGHSWQTAAAQAGLPISQSNAYRLWRAFRQRGETALSDGRHGHPIKLRGEARAFRLAHSQRATLHYQLLTLLFLEAVGLRRTWDLCGYTGQALALLTDRRLADGYRHIERFLAELAQIGAGEVLTDALAHWTASLWKHRLHVADDSVPVFYIDGHRKPVHADALIPRGLIGRTG